MAYDAFEAVVRAGDASDDASLASTTPKPPTRRLRMRASSSLDACSVSTTWPLSERAKKDTPRKARTRAVAIPYRRDAACATPKRCLTSVRALTHARGTSTVSIRRGGRERRRTTGRRHRAQRPCGPWLRRRRPTAGEIDRLLIMIDSDGHADCPCRLESGFIPPADAFPREHLSLALTLPDSDGAGAAPLVRPPSRSLASRSRVRTVNPTKNSSRTIARYRRAPRASGERTRERRRTARERPFDSRLKTT